MKGIYVILVHREGRATQCYLGRSTDIQRRWSDHRTALGRGDHDNPRLQRLWNTGEVTLTFEVVSDLSELTDQEITAQEQAHLDWIFQDGRCREGWLNCSRWADAGGDTSKAVRVHFADDRGIVEYPSGVEASRDLGLASHTTTGLILQGRQDLPEGIDWAEYVDDDTEARWCQDRWYRRQRPAEERGDAILATGPDGEVLEFPSIAAADRDERVPDSKSSIHGYLAGQRKNLRSGWTYSYVNGAARPRNHGRVVQAVHTETGEVLAKGSMAEVARHFDRDKVVIGQWVRGKKPQPCDQVRRRSETAHLASVRFQWAEDS